MGSAVHKSSGWMRFCLSAAAAAAVLYGAVVLFGLGPAFPVALGRSHDRGPSVVRVQAHDPAVSGPVQRGPQPSSGPARHRAARVGKGRAHGVAAVSNFCPHRGTHRAAPKQTGSARSASGPNRPAPARHTPTPLARPQTAQPTESALSLPEVTLPPLPEVPPPAPPTVPSLPLPPLPPLPQLPAPPSLPLP